MKIKLKRGRSANSWLVIASHNIHLFVWAPFMGNNAVGGTLRWRWGRDWKHLRLSLFQRNTLDVRRFNLQPGERLRLRPTLTLVEVAGWSTSNGIRNRGTLKSYLRIKLAAPGGKRTKG